MFTLLHGPYTDKLTLNYSVPQGGHSLVSSHLIFLCFLLLYNNKASTQTTSKDQELPNYRAI